MTDPANDQNLTVGLRFFGFTFTIFKVFVGVSSALAYMAEFRKIQPIRGADATETSP